MELPHEKHERLKMSVRDQISTLLGENIRTGLDSESLVDCLAYLEGRIEDLELKQDKCVCEKAG